MPDVTDFLPIRRESRHRIRARMDADVNAGVAPGDPRWLDTTEGGFYWDASQPDVLEKERLWDALSVEYPAVVFLPFSFGRYLDRHGEVLDVPRKAASYATGTLRFTGVDGTVVPTNAEVAVPGVGEEEPITYVTTAGGTIAGGLLDLPIQATELGSDSNAVPGAVILMLSAVPGVTSVTNPESITGGADVESDEAYLPRLLAKYVGIEGAGTLDDHERWATSYPGVGYAAVTPEDPQPGFVRVVLTDSLNDPVSAAVRDGYQAVVDPITATAALNGSHTFPVGTINVTGSTADFLDTGYLLIGTVIVKYTGKTASTFTGVTGGTGTLAGGTSIKQSGRGAGLAPVGQRVVIQTPALATIDWDATLVLEEGYTLDGTGGTNAVRPAIEAVLARYTNGLRPGDDIVINKGESLMFSVRGVYDTSNVRARINGGSWSTTNIAVATLEVPQLGAITLTEAP